MSKDGLLGPLGEQRQATLGPAVAGCRAPEVLLPAALVAAPASRRIWADVLVSGVPLYCFQDPWRKTLSGGGGFFFACVLAWAGWWFERAAATQWGEKQDKRKEERKENDSHKHAPFRIDFVVGLFALAKDADGIVGLASAAWARSVAL